MLHNATSYYVSIGSDLPLGSIVLNYTVYINLTHVGDPLGIFLSFLRSPIINEIFGFDNGLCNKDYISSNPQSYTVADNIATFEESIFYRNEVPESLFNGDIANFDFDLVTVVASTSSAFEDLTIVFVTATRTPGKTTNNFIIDRTLLPYFYYRSMS